jgi:hypothetical protein
MTEPTLARRPTAEPTPNGANPTTERALDAIRRLLAVDETNLEPAGLRALRDQLAAALDELGFGDG